jgi:ubiquinone/menaquinone biosynthesis C-methylase UbiE
MNSSFSSIAPQLKCPSGIGGKEVGKIMDAMNDLQNDWVLSLLNLQTKDIVLEIGFGTGKTIQKALSLIHAGKIYGVELSDTMLEEASQLLNKEILSEQVKLSKGNPEQLPYKDGQFDKIYAVHVVYFWKDISKVFSELYRVNKSGGITAIYFVSPILEPSPYFHEYSSEEIVSGLQTAGFGTIEVQRKKFGKQNGICILARK